MDIEQLRAMIRADVFRPFNLVIRGGRKLPVDKPYYLGIAPEATFLIHTSVGGGFELLSPNQIESIDFEDVRRPMSRQMA